MDNMTFQNFVTNGYMKLHTRNPFRCMYAYLDVKDYQADQLFMQQKVCVRFKHEMVYPNRDVVCVFVSCLMCRKTPLL